MMNSTLIKKCDLDNLRHCEERLVATWQSHIGAPLAHFIAQYDHPDTPTCHPEFISGSLKNSVRMLKQVQHDTIGVQYDTIGVQHETIGIQHVTRGVHYASSIAYDGRMMVGDR